MSGQIDYIRLITADIIDNVYNPYNLQNVEITEKELLALLQTYGVQFTSINDTKMLKQAFIHESYVVRELDANVVQSPCPPNCVPLGVESNERIECIGDAVLELAIKYYLYQRFPKEPEGFITTKKIALVKNETVGRISIEMGLHKWFQISKCFETQGLRTNIKKLGCLFEAFVGALFIQYGLDVATTFIISVFETHINWVELINTDDNYKNILQVKMQKMFKMTPHYIKLYEDENGYKMGVYMCFNMEIYNASHSNAISLTCFNSIDEINDLVKSGIQLLLFMGVGTHTMKKKAEQIACKMAIHTLENEINK